MKTKWIAVILSLVLILGLSFWFFHKPSLGVSDELTSEGIRTDVRLAIDELFPQSEKKRAAAIQLARALQSVIQDPEQGIKSYPDLDKALCCLDAVEGVGPFDRSTNTGDLIEQMVVNSVPRTRAYIRYNRLLSGRDYDDLEPDLAFCAFDISKMRN